MPLEIPPEDRGAIAIVKTLAPSSLDKLVAALKAAPPISNPFEMADLIAKQVSSFPKASLRPVLEMLYTLYHIRDLSGVSPATFLEDLLEGVNAPESELPKLRSTLDRLLSIDTLSVISKASRLQRDSERLYCTAKILSDIRPIFQKDPSLPPVGAVITHTLKIGYHEGRDHLEMHVVLDSDDLEGLAEVVRRAQLKDKTLRGFLKRSKLPNLGD